jgi:hypothetical protein
LSWSAAYTEVSGTLPLAELPAFEIFKDTGRLSVIRCHLDVTAGGKVKVCLNSVAGVTVWLAGNPIEPKQEMTVEVQPGLHTLTIAIDRGQTKESVRCLIDDVPESPARVSVVGGK